jgi:hypothetical protein
VQHTRHAPCARAPGPLPPRHPARLRRLDIWSGLFADKPLRNRQLADPDSSAPVDAQIETGSACEAVSLRCATDTAAK